MAAVPSQVVHSAYRQLYRALRLAVQDAKPEIYVARDQLRAAFRDPAVPFDEGVVKRTRWFLEGAARDRGMEHKVLKNLLRVRGEKMGRLARWKKIKSQLNDPFLENMRTGYEHYDMTVTMLNKSLGIHLR